MANSAQARKRARQAVNRRAHNMASRSTLRTSIKKVRAALTQGNQEDAQRAFQSAVPVIDKMARKGVLHKNAASRYKSRLNQAIKGLSA